MHHSITVKRIRNAKCRGLMGRVVLFGLNKGFTHRAIVLCFNSRLTDHRTDKTSCPACCIHGIGLFFLHQETEDLKCQL